MVRRLQLELAHLAHDRLGLLLERLEIGPIALHGIHIPDAILVTFLLEQDSRQMELQVRIVRGLRKQGTDAFFGTYPVPRSKTIASLGHQGIVPFYLGILPGNIPNLSNCKKQCRKTQD